MRTLLLAGTSLLAFSAATVAMAAPITFGFTGGVQTFTAATDGTYDILAFGAQGGSAQGGSAPAVGGGLGAEIGGDFALTAGETLTIAVGGGGGDGFNFGGGGGGGSFVVAPGSMPLVIAGGGGSGVVSSSGGGGNSSTSGGGGGGGGGYPGLQGGNGGSGSFSNGANGGFGGGGGGGGSFDAGTSQVLAAGFNAGNGSVTIIELPSAAVPKPASLAVVGSGLLGLGLIQRRRKAA